MIHIQVGVQISVRNGVKHWSKIEFKSFPKLPHQYFRTEHQAKPLKDKDLMGHKSNDVGEDEEGDKSIPLLPLRVYIDRISGLPYST